MKILNAQEDKALKQWESHDLLYHKRSRCTSQFWRSGATFRFKDTIALKSPIKKTNSDTLIPLYKPNIEYLSQNDMTFTKVLQSRKSCLEHCKTITIKELREFLYRAARIKSIFKQGPFEFIKANYPSAGSIYETEINLIIQKCSGLEQGVYHYDRDVHSLSRINDMTDEAEQLLVSNNYQNLKNEDIQILFIFSSRFQRIAWKYEGIAYSVMLKNAG